MRGCLQSSTSQPSVAVRVISIAPCRGQAQSLASQNIVPGRMRSERPDVWQEHGTYSDWTELRSHVWLSRSGTCGGGRGEVTAQKMNSSAMISTSHSSALSSYMLKHSAILIFSRTNLAKILNHSLITFILFDLIQPPHFNFVFYFPMTLIAVLYFLIIIE